MKVNRKEVLDALSAVMPGIKETELVDQSNCFVFSNGYVYTYNNEIAVSHPLKMSFEGAVPAKAFKALINKVTTETIDLVVNKGELLLASSKAKAGLRIQTEINLPLEQVGMPDEWIELPESFGKAIQFCQFSASKDEKKLILMNIMIKGQYAVSCDNHRITKYDMGKEAAKVFEREMLIPSHAVKDILSSNPVEYNITDGWIHFRNENDAIYSCRYFDDQYPNFEPFLNCEGNDVEFPDELPAVLDRANIFKDGDRVSIILEKDEFVVMGENESGWFEESIETKYDGEPLEFDIQPEFMKELLKFKGTATIGERSIRFDSDDFIHVCMIMQPKKK